MTNRLLFAQIKVGDEFYFESEKFRKKDNATALNIKSDLDRFFDQFDSIELISAE